MNDGGPAFPQPIDDAGTLRAKTGGMSLRDWFAGMAMSWKLDGFTGSTEKLAHTCYEVADAMLKEREKNNPPK